MSKILCQSWHCLIHWKWLSKTIPQKSGHPTRERERERERYLQQHAENASHLTTKNPIMLLRTSRYWQLNWRPCMDTSQQHITHTQWLHTEWVLSRGIGELCTYMYIEQIAGATVYCYEACITAKTQCFRYASASRCQIVTMWCGHSKLRTGCYYF